MASMPYGVTNNLMIPEGFTIGTQNGVEVADAINGEQSIEQALENMEQGHPQGLGGRRLLRLARSPGEARESDRSAGSYSRCGKGDPRLGGEWLASRC